uniref:Ig-like domain-containing protein n=1 Tax=Dicentrarchus labrax TaxID=13489 RepID=A0A8C4DL55_DICLA
MCVCAACCCCQTSDKQIIVKPVVSVYPAETRKHLEVKSFLLCVASAMFPPLVRFSWKRQKDNGPLEKVTSADKKQLKLRESGRTTSMLLIPQRESGTYKYYCSVQHEGGTVKAQIEQGNEGLVTYQVKLLCLMYTVLIVKSLVYCCGLSLLMILRNKGPSTNCTHAVDYDTDCVG